MRFEVFGPFDIPLEKPKRIPRIPDDLDAFWRSVEKKRAGLSTAIGCYVFGIQSAGGPRIKPWYVGKTNKQDFLKECFAATKLNHYHKAFSNYQRAKPVMFLIPKLTPKRGYSKHGSAKDIDFLEKFLIGMALEANRDLCNKKDTRLYQNIVLPGFFNSPPGPTGKAAQALKHALKI